MKPDYQVGYSVRLLRRLGWVFTLLVGSALVLALGWKLAEVSEARAVAATRAHLASALAHLAAEHMAQDRGLDADWAARNPFVLLRWQQNDYCGEWRRGDKWRSGCWYWLPEVRWVLYRSRFGDGWAGQRYEMQVYRVQPLPGDLLTGSQSAHHTVALELQAVTQAEIAALGWLANEGTE